MIKALLIFSLIFFFNYISAQQENVSGNISSIAEELAGDATDPDAVESFSDKLQDLNEKPVMLNSADESELSRLFFLSDFQVKALIDYIKSSGPVLSINEIAAIPGFDSESASMISHFISLDPVEKMFKGPTRMNNSFLSNFSLRNSANAHSTYGSQWKVLTKYRFSAGRISGGITGEKDAGEKLIDGKPPLPDFFSAHIAFRGSGFVRNIVIGDFGARFGTGTGINTSLRTGLSLTQPGYLSGKDELKPYNSTDENIFLRGVAVQFRIKKAGISAFYSLSRLDASIDTSSTGKPVTIRTFIRSGLHTSAAESATKDIVSENCFGVNFSMSFNKSDYGVVFTGSRFSLPVDPKVNSPVDLYDFTGQRNLLLSAYYKTILTHMIIYGELSSNINKRFALIQGMIFRPSDRLSLNILYRNYHPGFISFHGKGIFSGTAGNNAKGIFGNFTFEAARHLFISAGCDLCYYPWLRYRCSAPSTSISHEARIRYLPTDQLTFEVLYNNRSSSVNFSETSGIIKQQVIRSFLIKAVVKYAPVKNLILSTRMDYRNVEPEKGKGILLLQDLNLRFNQVPLSLWFRYCVFKTGTWDSRLYTFENDLYQSVSIPALAGEGNRSYIMIDWRPGRYAEFRLKLGYTSCKQEAGSVTETNELKLQVRIWF